MEEGEAALVCPLPLVYHLPPVFPFLLCMVDIKWRRYHGGHDGDSLAGRALGYYNMKGGKERKKRVTRGMAKGWRVEGRWN